MRQSDEIGRHPQGAQGPYWLICRDGLLRDTRQDLLTLGLPGFGQILPIFGSKEGALDFVRGSSGGEPHSPLKAIHMGRWNLVSELRSALASIDRIAFDPLPEPNLVATVMLASIGRASFVDLVLGRGRAWSTRDSRDGAFRA